MFRSCESPKAGQQCPRASEVPIGDPRSRPGRIRRSPRWRILGGQPASPCPSPAGGAPVSQGRPGGGRGIPVGRPSLRDRRGARPPHPRGTSLCQPRPEPFRGDVPRLLLACGGPGGPCRDPGRPGGGLVGGEPPILRTGGGAPTPRACPAGLDATDLGPHPPRGAGDLPGRCPARPEGGDAPGPFPGPGLPGAVDQTPPTPEGVEACDPPGIPPEAGPGGGQDARGSGRQAGPGGPRPHGLHEPLPLPQALLRLLRGDPHTPT